MSVGANLVFAQTGTSRRKRKKTGGKETGGKETGGKETGDGKGRKGIPRSL
jgi:hypothetical protein